MLDIVIPCPTARSPVSGKFQIQRFNFRSKLLLAEIQNSTFCRTNVIACAAVRGPVRTASVGRGEWNKAIYAAKAVSP